MVALAKMRVAAFGIAVGVVAGVVVAGENVLSGPSTSAPTTQVSNEQTLAPGSGSVTSGSWAIVRVVTHTGDDTKSGYGAVIGDGTLVVTAYHMVNEESAIGAHHMPGTVKVISPYLGDARIGRVIADDRERDLAILAVPWQGHPAYSLAAAEEIVALKAAAVVVTGKPGLPDGGFETVQREEILVDSVVLMHGVISQLALANPAQAGEGWSGCPVVSKETGQLVGSFTSIRGEKAKLRYVGTTQPSPRMRRLGIAVAAPAVAQVLAESGHKYPAKVDSPAKRPEDAAAAMEVLARAMRARSAGGDLSGAINDLKEFLAHRPDSDAGSAMLASWSEGDPAAEKICVATAAKYPDSPDIRAIYAQTLADQGKLDQALAQYDMIDRKQADGGSVDCLVVQTLLEMKRANAAADRANEAITRYPENARLYCLRGVAKISQGMKDQGIADLQSAVSLWPDNGNFRYALARFLEQSGRLDEAVMHLRDAVDINPAEAQYRMALANVLVRQSPQNKPEAIAILEQAQKLKLSPEAGKAVESMLSTLRQP